MEVVLGYDTEWESTGGVQGKVALIQLGVPTAVLLYRCQVGHRRAESLPPVLLNLLNDNNFIKVTFERVFIHPVFSLDLNLHKHD